MSKTYESLEPQGHFNFAKRVFQKIKGYIDNKVQTDVPANATFTDTKVTQTQDNNTNDNFEILLAGSTSTSTATEGAKKTNSITFNPSQQAITIGSRKANSTIGSNSFASGYNVEASGSYAHAEGAFTTASGNYAHAEGLSTTASGSYSHTEGYYTTASSDQSHAEGGGTKAGGSCAHAEGGGTTASGIYSHAEGLSTTASNSGAHAEGTGTTASGDGSHAEGASTTASGNYAHTEGGGTKATGNCAHAEGGGTKATGAQSHAEGNSTEASGECAHAEGGGTIANHQSQHVFGECNIADPSTAPTSDRGTYVEIVGNGISTARSNARTLDWDGNEVLSGKLTVGTAPTNNMDVTTKQYVDTGLASADEIIEITATDYDALSYAEKHNGKYYHITDRNSSNELDTKVTQTQDDSTNATYEVLLAGSTLATTATESAKKSSGLTYNPSTSVLSMSGTPSGNTDVVTKAYADGKVDKTGDTMTGDLNTTASFANKYNGVEVDNSSTNHVSSDTQLTSVEFKDKNDFVYSGLNTQVSTSGLIETWLNVKNKKTDGSVVSNYIDLLVAKDGTRSYEVADPTAFRKAIGFGGSNGVNSWFSTEPSAISVASGTMVDVYEYTLSAGIYMIHYIGNWDKNATGVRIIVMDAVKASVNGGRKTANTMFLNSYASSYDGFQEHFRFIGVTGDTPFYFRAFQNSGATLKIYPVINIIKLQ